MVRHLVCRSAFLGLEGCKIQWSCEYRLQNQKKSCTIVIQLISVSVRAHAVTTSSRLSTSVRVDMISATGLYLAKHSAQKCTPYQFVRLAIAQSISAVRFPPYLQMIYLPVLQH